MMTLEELIEAYPQKHWCDKYIVEIRLKHKWETEFRTIREYVSFVDDHYEFEHDWNEGQEYEYVGIVALYDIPDDAFWRPHLPGDLSGAYPTQGTIKQMSGPDKWTVENTRTRKVTECEIKKENEYDKHN